MLSVQVFHDCVKPTMITHYVDEDRTYGVWPFRRRVTLSVPVYAAESAKWTCPQCKSRWVYYNRGFGGVGFWESVERTSEWKQVSEDEYNKSPRVD